MSVFAATASATATLELPTGTTVANITAPNKDTQYSVALPDGTKQFIFRIRGCCKLQYAYVSGDTNTTFMTLKQGCFRYVSDVSPTSGTTLYFEVAKDSQVLEIESWQA